MADFFTKTIKLLSAALKKARPRRIARRSSRMFIERLESRQLLATIMSGVTLNGTAYYDANGNAQFDANESGVSGVTVYLDLNNDNTLDPGDPSTTTNSQGQYSLAIPNNTTAVVREVVPAGWSLTGPSSGSYNVGPASNTTLTGLNFGNQISNPSYFAQITGNVFNDLSQSGQFNANDPGLGQWEVFLDQNNNGLVDPGEQWTYTDANGNYSFNNLVPGTYTVREVLQTGWQQSLPTSNGSQTVAAGAHDTVANVNFGNYLVESGTITGTKWQDVTGSGVQTSGDPGVAGVTVYLDDIQNGNIVPTDISTVTDANGNYTFTNVPPGPHIVAEVVPPTWQQTSPGKQTGFTPAPLVSIPFDANGVGANANQVQAVDFNGDGKPDLMVFDQNRGMLSILNNQGANNFTSPQQIYVGTDVRYVLTGDVTGDKLPDIVTVADEAATATHPRDIRIDTRTNNGNGTFTLTSSVEIPGILDYATLADANNNGILDVVLSRFLTPGATSTQLAIITNDGKGDFTYSPNQIMPQVTAGAIVTGDFTGDGYLDEVVADPANNQLDFFKNNGNGTFAPPVFLSAGTQPSYIVSGDLTGNGMTDLMAVDSGSGNLTEFLNQGNGTFAPGVTVGTGLEDPVAAALSNLAGTGALDLAVADAGGNNVSIFFNNGSGTYTAGPTYNVGTNPTAIVSGDLVGNGEMDLAVANSGSDNISILLNNGSGTFSSATPYNVGASPTSITTGDLSGNSSLDLLVGTSTGSNLEFLNNGNGTFGTVQPFIPSYSSDTIVTGDFNGDSATDIMSPLEYSNNVLLWLNDGKGDFLAPQSIDVGGRANMITTGDFTGNGNLDFVTSYLDSDNLGIFLNNGNGTFTSGGTITLTAPATSIVTGDFEGNGNIDVLVATGSNSTLSLYSNNGSGVFTLLTQVPNTGTGSVAAADLTGDGRLDIITSLAGNYVGVLLNSLAPNFEQNVAVTAGATTGTVNFGNQKLSWTNPNNPSDVNGDGTVSPLDALILINFLDVHGSELLTSQTPFQAPYLDPSGDGYIAPNDVLMVINYLDQQAVPSVAQPAVASGASSNTALVGDSSVKIVNASPAVAAAIVASPAAASPTVAANQTSAATPVVIVTPALTTNISRTTQALVAMQAVRDIPSAPLKDTSITSDKDELESSLDDIAGDVSAAWLAGSAAN